MPHKQKTWPMSVWKPGPIIQRRLCAEVLMHGWTFASALIRSTYTSAEEDTGGSSHQEEETSIIYKKYHGFGILNNVNTTIYEFGNQHILTVHITTPWYYCHCAMILPQWCCKEFCSYKADSSAVVFNLCHSTWSFLLPKTIFEGPLARVWYFPLHPAEIKTKILGRI